MGDQMPTLGIFAKRPLAGAVKTRLAAAVGAEAAAKFYEVSLRTLLARVRGINLRRVIAVAPTAAVYSTQERSVEDHSTTSPPPSPDIQWFQPFASFELWPQPPGDLGQKLAAWFDFACSSDDRVLVIGSDSPTLPLEFIEQAMRELETADCVIGPALDGGYYLLGLRRANPRLFDGIEWSSPKVLEQTRDRAAELQLRVAELPPWNDVDEFADLAILHAQLKTLGPAAVWEPLRAELGRLIHDSGSR